MPCAIEACVRCGELYEASMIVIGLCLGCRNSAIEEPSDPVTEWHRKESYNAMQARDRADSRPWISPITSLRGRVESLAVDLMERYGKRPSNLYIGHREDRIMTDYVNEYAKRYTIDTLNAKKCSTVGGSMFDGFRVHIIDTESLLEVGYGHN